MLAFIIPVKSQTQANSWPQVCQLLERTLRSVCNQTCPEFQAFVICNERPKISFDDSRIHYVEVDFPFPNNGEEIIRKRVDKGRKLLAGIWSASQKEEITHVMTMDADDCINHQIAHIVHQSPGSPGWFAQKGYIYSENVNKLYLKRRKFFLICGSCNVVRLDLMAPSEQPDYTKGFNYYRFYIAHQDVKKTLEERGFYLAPLRFPAAIYVNNHGENFSDRTYSGSTNSQYRKSIKPWNQRPFTSRLKEEFGFYNTSEVNT